MKRNKGERNGEINYDKTTITKRAGGNYGLKESI